MLPCPSLGKPKEPRNRLSTTPQAGNFHKSFSRRSPAAFFLGGPRRGLEEMALPPTWRTRRLRPVGARRLGGFEALEGECGLDLRLLILPVCCLFALFVMSWFCSCIGRKDQSCLLPYQGITRVGKGTSPCGLLVPGEFPLFAFLGNLG